MAGSGVALCFAGYDTKYIEVLPLELADDPVASDWEAPDPLAEVIVT